MSFTEQSVGDQTGRIFVITGANSGIGFEVARVLVARGARVVLACRDAKKMAEAAQALSGKVDQLVLDLSDLASIRAAAKQLAALVPHVDVLINNAGIMAIPERQTKDGFEMQFGTNHLGHFAFTGLVLPLVRDRVVTTSSLLHTRGTWVPEDVPRPKNYNQDKAYAMSKLANVLFSNELNRRLVAAGSKVRALTSHPGYSATNLQGVGPAMTGSKGKALIMRVMNAVIAQPAAVGALGTLYAAVGAEMKGGEYVGSVGLGGLRGPPKIGKTSPAAQDLSSAKQLWELSERLTGVTYSFSI
jgi:NAD(P)-dependent dehydrogenase (short-subunit alcohol dehydrogenase family)